MLVYIFIPSTDNAINCSQEIARKEIIHYQFPHQLATCRYQHKALASNIRLLPVKGFFISESLWSSPIWRYPRKWLCQGRTWKTISNKMIDSEDLSWSGKTWPWYIVPPSKKIHSRNPHLWASSSRVLPAGQTQMVAFRGGFKPLICLGDRQYLYGANMWQWRI